MVRAIGLLFILSAFVLAACGAGPKETAFTSIGMAEGKPSFLFLYTET